LIASYFTLTNYIKFHQPLPCSKLNFAAVNSAHLLNWHPLRRLVKQTVM